MSINDSQTSGTKWYLRLVIRSMFGILLVVAIIFIPAGRINYWQGWVFSGVMVLILIVSILMFANKPDLIKEREKPGPGTKWWDKIFYALYIPAFFAVVIIACLDTGRFGWTAPFPIPVYVIGYILFLFANFINTWSMWVNRFFSSTVRIQTDRGQEVIQTGPYRWMRHPGYVGGILLAISMAVIFGSLWALIPAGIVAILLVIRTYLEDTTLQKELAGYTDYVSHVKYRLLPGIW